VILILNLIIGFGGEKAVKLNSKDLVCNMYLGFVKEGLETLTLKLQGGALNHPALFIKSVFSN